LVADEPRLSPAANLSGWLAPSNRKKFLRVSGRSCPDDRPSLKFRKLAFAKRRQRVKVGCLSDEKFDRLASGSGQRRSPQVGQTTPIRQCLLLGCCVVRKATAHIGQRCRHMARAPWFARWRLVCFRRYRCFVGSRSPSSRPPVFSSSRGGLGLTHRATNQ